LGRGKEEFGDLIEEGREGLSSFRKVDPKHSIPGDWQGMTCAFLDDSSGKEKKEDCAISGSMPLFLEAMSQREKEAFQGAVPREKGGRKRLVVFQMSYAVKEKLFHGGKPISHIREKETGQ